MVRHTCLLYKYVVEYLVYPEFWWIELEFSQHHIGSTVSIFLLLCRTHLEVRQRSQKWLLPLFLAMIVMMKNENLTSAAGYQQCNLPDLMLPNYFCCL